MTERSFRETPPNRPASSHGPYPRYDQDDAPPPVPALPKGYVSPLAVPQKSGRRAASVEPPERVGSPPPKKFGGRGMSLDRESGYYKGSAGNAKPKLPALESVGELERAASRSSVNFSRPMSPQNSPPISPLAGDRARSPLPNRPASAVVVPTGEAERIPGSLQEEAGRPVKKKKKAATKMSAEGSHLASGASGDTPQSTAVIATPQPHTQSAHSTPSSLGTGPQSNVSGEVPRLKKKKKKTVPSAGSLSQEPSEGFGSSYPSDTDSVTSELSSTTDRPRGYNTRAAGLLAKQPSIVREDCEGEEKAERRLQRSKVNGHEAQNGFVGERTSNNTPKIVSKDRQHTRAASQPYAQQSAVNAPSLDLPNSGRPLSLSPARAAHFSSQPVYETSEGTKHQPPARSVSPAKSALKNSPSRGHSPIVNRGQGLAPSEASDTASQISEDGSRSAPKKKRSVRVSFDDASVAVGRAASPMSTPDSPVMMSPQSKAKPRSWFDLVRDRKQEQPGSELDQDSVIKPTPALPSFGSVRGRGDEKTTQPVGRFTPSGNMTKEALRGVDTSSDQAVGDIISQDTVAKSTKDSLPPSIKRSPSDPLPPEVTSVEGSGDHSDEGGLFDDERAKAPEARVEISHHELENTASKPPPHLEAAVEESSPREPVAPVPSIAIEPATPGVDEALSKRQSWLGMPGEFPASAEAITDAQPPTTHASERHSPVITPATIGVAEPEPEAVAAHHELGSPVVGEVAEGLQTQIVSHSGDGSEDTADSSIYSDAAEDQSDTEGDGFGSINAIVESPVSPSKTVASKSPPASPSHVPKGRNTRSGNKVRSEHETSEPASDEGWDRAQAYWSGLTQTRRQQLEQAAVPGAIDEPVIPDRTMRKLNSVQKKKKKKVKKAPLSAGSNDAPLPPWPDRQYHNDVARSPSPQASALKTSMRNSQPERSPEPRMRSSMRDGTQEKVFLKKKTQRSSMQPLPEPKSALPKKNRPVSAVAMVDYNKPKAESSLNHTRAVSAGGPSTSLTPVLAQTKTKAPALVPKLYRAKSDNSDSSSSFKKQRPTLPDTSKYSMKRTMRSSSGDAARPLSLAANGASSMSARASSTTGSVGRRPFSPVSPGGMRTSMRGSIDSTKTARTSFRSSGDSVKQNRTKSPSRFSFGKASRVKPVESKSASRFSSRFRDSSDEDEYPKVTSSRFADSSDDDEPVALSAVRGIPRRIDEGDSTDLEDSSIENAMAPIKAKVNGAQVVASSSPQGLALATGSLRTPSGGNGPIEAMGSGLHAKTAAVKDKKKRSFFGSLGSKRQGNTTRVRKSDIESPARRDTPLERTREERILGTRSPKPNDRMGGRSSPTTESVPLKMEKPLEGTMSRTSTAQNSPKSPKLQRRNTPKKFTSVNDISWPLAQSPASTVSTPTSRPRTSDGAVPSIAGVRPDIGTRRFTVQSEDANDPAVAAAVAVGRNSKKKRFPMLRKAFGLHG